jgi:lipid A 3-O-deacylase
VKGCTLVDGKWQALALGISLAAVTVQAQAQTSPGVLNESPVTHEASLAPWEFGALFQGGVGLTENRSNFRFLMAGAHLGKVLTPEVGTGFLRGNFEYAGELFPYWQSFTPSFQRISCTYNTGPSVNPTVCSNPYTVGGTFTGVSVTPIILRWNFTHGRRVMPWVQGAGGLLWTNHKYPAYGNTTRGDVTETGPGSDTSVWNFTPQFGVGTHIFLQQRRSLDFGANAVHISSASLGDRNPGVNASVQFSVGYTWWSR